MASRRFQARRRATANLPLSPEQRAAVASEEAALVVQAAAGSGKTRVLVARFCKHVLEDGISADSILTLTFTRKAAAHMKRRIVDALRAAGREEQAQLAETGPIQTIHSFCERLLRENALEAGVDPDFLVLDPADARERMESAISRALAECEGPEVDGLLAAVAGKRRRGDPRAHAELHESVRGALERLRGTVHRREDVAQSHSDPRAWAIRARRAMAVEAGLDPARLPEDEAHFYEWVRDECKKNGLPLPGWIPKSSATPGIVAAEPGHAAAACGLAQIACRAWELLESGMAADQEFDFALLERLAVDLVAEPRAQARVRGRFRVLLVDEAQDLNPVQYKLLGSLGIEVEMSVGDRQQSIYGFRQADVRLFLEKASRTTTLDLPANYRSEAPILRVVDRLFGSLWDGYSSMLPEGGAAGPEFENVEVWRHEDKDWTPVAEWIAGVCEEDGPGNVAVLVRRAATIDLLQPRLEDLGIPVRTFGVGDRFYVKLEVRDLANTLAALADPSDDFALLAALRSPMAGLSLDTIVRLAREPGIAERLPNFEPRSEPDRRKLAAFLDWFFPLREQADRMPAWEAVAIIHARSQYLENLARRPNARQTLANARKLLALAADRPEAHAGAFAKSVRRLRELKYREGDAPAVDESEDAVSLMTIHKSKGLEFPTVILPDTRFRAERSAEPLEVDKELGLVAYKAADGDFPVRDFLASRRKGRELQEEWRTLYVGMTRAQRRLCLVVAGGAAGSTMAHRIAAQLNPDPGEMPGLRVRSSEPLSASPIWGTFGAPRVRGTSRTPS